MSSERTHRTESARAGVALSLVLHAALAGLVVYGALIGHLLPLGGAHPGTAAAGAMQATLVSSVPGGAIPMPTPIVTPTKNRLASDSAAKGITRPTRAAAPRHSVALPAYDATRLAREEARRELRKLAQADRDKKNKYVPNGSGGAVSFDATNGATGASGSGGVSFGDANFGNLYTDWVNHLRDRLQFYWNQQPRDPTLAPGQKVTVTLTVHRNGLIDSIHYVRRSGSVEVNGMAFNSVEQMAAAEHFPLPPGYVPASLTVTVAFLLN
ncbi:MAG: TonB C-terminal domain-containing protein [Terriglobales bacterium]